jgi:hypothetical protein
MGGDAPRPRPVGAVWRANGILRQPVDLARRGVRVGHLDGTSPVLGVDPDHRTRVVRRLRAMSGLGASGNRRGDVPGFPYRTRARGRRSRPSGRLPAKEHCLHGATSVPGTALPGCATGHSPDCRQHRLVEPRLESLDRAAEAEGCFVTVSPDAVPPFRPNLGEPAGERRGGTNRWQDILPGRVEPAGVEGVSRAYRVNPWS